MTRRLPIIISTAALLLAFLDASPYGHAAANLVAAVVRDLQEHAPTVLVL